MLGEPTDFWGKLEQDDDGGVLAWHPVEAHCADVAACCEALLGDTLLGARFARLCGRDALDPILRDRLTVLAVLHDLGKFAISFQNRPYPDRRPQGGHIEPIVQALSNDGMLKERILALLEPLHVFGESWGNYLFASISHHGRPEQCAPGPFDASVFAPARGLDPLAGMARLVGYAQRWCPNAFREGGELLPDDAAAQHFFAGLVMLGDWLGSDKRVFEFSEDLSTDPMPIARERAARVIRERFFKMDELRGHTRAEYSVFHPEFVPRPAQETLSALELPPTDRGSLTVLEAETGSGKTEAAIHRFAQLLRAGRVDGLYFALPTRTSATQIHERVRKAVASTFTSLPASERPPVVLAVPGYLRVDDEEGQRLPKFEFLWPDDRSDRHRHRTWAAENSKRYLAGSVVVGTVDQVLLSTLVVSHSHLRAMALSRLFLVVDEVHASDAYMTALLDRVLAFHVAAGGHALLMSATLGTDALIRYAARVTTREPLRDPPRPKVPDLAAACDRPYPAISTALPGGALETHFVEAPSIAKRCHVELVPEIDAPGAIAARALEAARAGAQVLVLRNTVADAVATQAALERIAGVEDAPLLFRVGDVVTLHHARFASEDRKALDAAIEARLGRDAARKTGIVVIATQTVQQSLDLDADLLITDLCPMDVLLQRIGRLHRHARAGRPPAFAAPRCLVLDPGPMIAMLRDDGEVDAQHGFGSVYDDLRVLEATRELCLERTVLEIPKDNRMLVERTTHPRALEEIGARSAAFIAHTRKVSVQAIVKRQVAEGHGVSRREVFGDYAYPSREICGRIATRLGESDRRLELDPAFFSPFGERVRELKIPHWLARDIPLEPRARVEPRALASVTVVVEDGDGNVCARFVYDRWGLRSERQEEELHADD